MGHHPPGGHELDLLGDVPAAERSVSPDERNQLAGDGLRARLQIPEVDGDRRRVAIDPGPKGGVVSESHSHRHVELIRQCQDRLERWLGHRGESGARIKCGVVVRRPLDDDLPGSKLREISEEPPPRFLAPRSVGLRELDEGSVEPGRRRLRQ